MTANEYQKLCMHTASGVAAATPDNLMVQGVMGMCGEAGEAIEVVKKTMFHGHDLDRDHLIRELGDVLWYIATTAEALGVTLEDVMIINIAKLRTRYPDGFHTDESLHRKEGDV